MRKYLLASSLALIGTNGLADSYIDGGVKWEFFAPRIFETVRNFEPESDLEARVTNLGVHDGSLGADANRINSIVPIVGSNYARINMSDFGTTLGGRFPYETYYTKGTKSPKFKTKQLNFFRPIEVLKEFGKVKKFTVPEYTLPNRASATFTVSADKDDTFIFKFRPAYRVISEETQNLVARGKIKGSVDHYKPVALVDYAALNPTGEESRVYAKPCEISVFINGERMFLDDEYDRASFIYKAKKGDHEVKFINGCDIPTEYIGSYKPTSKMIISDMEFEVYSKNNQANLEVVNFVNKRKKYKLKKQSSYSNFERSTPYLYGWSALDLDNFITPEQLKYQKAEDIEGVLPSLQKVNLASLELVLPDLQDQLLDDKTQGLRKLLKGTFFPTVEGKYHLAVIKMSNVVDNGADNKDGRKQYLQPIYGVSFNNRSAMAHSKWRTRQRSTKPFEYDWFNFDVRARDVKWGMDFSLFAMANIGRNTIRTENCTAANPCGKTDREILGVLNGKVVHLTADKSVKYDIYASQKIALYIKAPNEKFYRPLQMSDFNPKQEEEKVAVQVEKFNNAISGKLEESDEEALDLMSGFE